MTVANGTLLTTSIGVKFGLTNASDINFADTSGGIAECVGFISGSKGLFQLNNSAVHNT